MLAKLKTVVVLTMFGLLAFGGGVLTYRPAAAQQGQLPETPRSRPPAAPDGAAQTEGNPVRSRAAEYSAVFERVASVLGERFPIEYANRFDGRIETAPVRKPKPDPADPGVSVPSVRLRAVAQIGPGADGTFWVQVQVFREVENALAEWEHAGRDFDLEQVFLKRLGGSQAVDQQRENAGKRSAPPPVPLSPAEQEVVRLREQVKALEARLAALEARLPAAPDNRKDFPSRVGQIFIKGNQKTPAATILKKVPLVPGQVFDFTALRTAEKNLAKFHATVEALDNGGGSGYVDILVTVKEE
jgi:hypothetical protein